MAKPRKKGATAGAHAPAAVARAGGARRYRFTCAHTHADTRYVAGDAIVLTDAKAELIRRYAGADALTDDEG